MPRVGSAGAPASDTVDAYSYEYRVRADRLIAEQEGSVTVSGQRRRLESRTDGAAVVRVWPDATRCLAFDVQRRTSWECSEVTPVPSAVTPEISRLSVREVPPPEDATGGPAGLRRRAHLLSCRLTTPLPGGAKNPASRFLSAYVEDVTVELVVWEEDAPLLVVPWRLHAHLLRQRLPTLEDALIAALASREGRPARLRVRTTRTAAGGSPLRDDVEIVFTEFRPSSADASFFEVPGGYRHEKPVVGVPVR